jgi:hypothetical protein
MCAVDKNLNEHSRLLKWGLKDEKIVSVKEVANGLRDRVLCAACGQLLVAKNNPRNVKESHFAHMRNFNCTSAVETVIHKLAKQILQEERTLYVPAFIKRGPKSNIQYLNAKTVTFDTVEIEKKMMTGTSYIVGDVVGTINGKLLVVEFAYSHFVDEIKFQKLREGNFPCIEIDINSLSQDKDNLIKELTNFNANVHWIYNPRGEGECKKDWESHRNKTNQKRLAKEKKVKDRIAEKMELYKEHDYQFISTMPGGSFTCPAKQLIREGFGLTRFGRDEIVQKILSGQNWDGLFYLTGTFRRHIIISELCIEIKNDWRGRYRLMSLLKYHALEKLLSRRPCKNCSYLVEKIRGQTVCSFKNGNLAQTYKFYDYEKIEKSDPYSLESRLNLNSIT